MEEIQQEIVQFLQGAVITTEPEKFEGEAVTEI